MVGAGQPAGEAEHLGRVEVRADDFRIKERRQFIRGSTEGASHARAGQDLGAAPGVS